MALTSSFYIALASATSTGVVVGIPLTYIYREELGLNSNIPQIPKITQVAEFENLEKCSNENGEVISFGEKVKKACGFIEKSVDSTMNNVEDQKYTHLFKKVWNNQHGPGSSQNDYGKTHCDKDLQNKGTFSAQVVGGESLGLCDNTQVHNQGLTVRTDNDTTVESCSGDCFETKTLSHGKTLDSSRKKGTGSKFSFRKMA